MILPKLEAEEALLIPSKLITYVPAKMDAVAANIVCSQTGRSTGTTFAISSVYLKKHYSNVIRLNAIRTLLCAFFSGCQKISAT